MRFILFACIAAHAISWLRYIDQSFWLDETGAVWLTEGGVMDAWRRSLLLLHGPLFAWIVSIARSFGSSEIAIRLPAWFAGVASLWLLWKLARELFDRDAADLAVAIFASWPLIGYASTDARPYAFAMAAILASYLFLIRATKSGSSKNLGLFALSTAAIAWLQLLFAYVLVVPALYLFAVRRDSLRVHFKFWATSAIAIATLLLPLYWHYQTMVSWGRGYSYVVPTFGLLAAIYFPTVPARVFLGFAFIGSLISRKGGRIEYGPVHGPTFALIAATVPLVVAYSAHITTGSSIFLPRYFLPAIPGLALFGGCLLARMNPRWLRYSVACISMSVILAGQLYFGDGNIDREDWRAAVRRADALAGDGPILLYPAFVESAKNRSLPFLGAPLTAYRVRSQSVIILPLNATAISIPSSRTVTAVLRWSFEAGEWERRITERLAGSGYALRNSETFTSGRTIKVLHFSKTP